MNEIEVAFKEGFQKEAKSMTKESLGPLALLAPFGTAASSMGYGFLGSTAASILGTGAMAAMDVDQYHPGNMMLSGAMDAMSSEKKQQPMMDGSTMSQGQFKDPFKGEGFDNKQFKENLESLDFENNEFGFSNN